MIKFESKREFPPLDLMLIILRCQVAIKLSQVIYRLINFLQLLRLELIIKFDKHCISSTPKKSLNVTLNLQFNYFFAFEKLNSSDLLKLCHQTCSNHRLNVIKKVIGLSATISNFFFFFFVSSSLLSLSVSSLLLL